MPCECGVNGDERHDATWLTFCKAAAAAVKQAMATLCALAATFLNQCTYPHASHPICARRYDFPGGVTPSTAPGVIKAATLVQHQLLAPLYTQHLQPLGTPARTATWDGAEAWPQWAAVRAHIKHLVAASDSTALANIQAWFKPHHKAWVSQGVAVSTEQVVSMLPQSADV